MPIHDWTRVRPNRFHDFVQPVAVGEVLPDMPIFLTSDRYIDCPLEATYQVAWEQFPAPLKGPLEASP
jgi:hypothetical protein